MDSRTEKFAITPAEGISLYSLAHDLLRGKLKILKFAQNQTPTGYVIEQGPEGIVLSLRRFLLDLDIIPQSFLASPINGTVWVDTTDEAHCILAQCRGTEYRDFVVHGRLYKLVGEMVILGQKYEIWKLVEKILDPIIYDQSEERELHFSGYQGAAREEPLDPALDYPLLVSQVLKNIEKGEGKVTADTDLFYTDWSSDFVHGADSLLAIIGAAENMLLPDEKILKIDQLRWRKPMLSQMRLTVTLHPLTIHERRNSILMGTLTTTNDRTIYFFGVSNRDEITSYKEENPFAVEMISPISFTYEDDDFFILGLSKLQQQSAKILHSSHGGLLLSTIVELINYGIMTAVRAGVINRNEVALISGIENVVIERPELLGIAAGKLRMKALNDQQQETLSGFLLTPFYFEILVGENIVAKGIYSVATNIENGEGRKYLNNCIEEYTGQ